MKLATYKDGSRNGQLVVVSRDLSMAHYATGIAHTLPQALDDWNFIAPQLQDLYVTLNQGKARHAFTFDPRMCMAPLPRPHGCLWAGSPPMPARTEGWQGPVGELAWPVATGGQSQAALAVVLGEVPAGCDGLAALEGVRLLGLMHAVVAPLWPGEARGAPLNVAWAPVAVTPDEVGAAWTQGVLQLPLHCRVEGQAVRSVEGADAPFKLVQVLAQTCQFLGLGAGSVVALPWATTLGAVPEISACAVRLEVRGRDGSALMGAIDHTLVRAD